MPLSLSLSLSLSLCVCVCVCVCVTLCVCGVAFDISKVNTFKRRNGDLQIEHKKQNKTKDSLIFKSEFQDSQGRAITWNWLNSYQQFLNSNKNGYREVKKKKKTNHVEWSARVKDLLHYLPTLAVFWISYLISLSTYIEFNTCEGRLKKTIKKKRKHEEWDKTEI